MFENLLPLYPLLIPFLLVLFRVVGLFIFVPGLNNAAIPGNVKILLALVITVCIWPVVPKTATLPEGWIGLIIAVIGEMSVGLLMGVMVSLVFSGVQMGAHMLSQQMGLSLAAVYDPGFEEQSTVIEQFGFWLALSVFFAIGGHRELIAGLVHSYQMVPMGRGGDVQAMLDVAVGCMESSVHLAARVGAPALVAFLLATLSTGFIARSMPQMNLMSIGLTLNLLVGFGMIMVGLASWAVVTNRAWLGLFESMGRVFGG